MKKNQLKLPGNGQRLFDVAVIALLGILAGILPFAQYTYKKVVYTMSGLEFMTGKTVYGGKVTVAPNALVIMTAVLFALLIAVSLIYPVFKGRLRMKVYAKANVQWYLQQKLSELMSRVVEAKNYKDWFAIAEEKSRLDLLAIQSEIELDTTEINGIFQNYALEQFGKLSSSIDKDTPVLVSKAMDYMHEHSEKFVIIVMDGMSEFDWRIFSTSFDGIKYEQAAAFAMIPSTTSISRQCLLSNKYPSQLVEPWKQSKEKTEFIDCAKKLGYTDAQIGYERGYDASFGSFVRCGAVIINDVDDMVHAQTQGRIGMYHDIKLLTGQKKLSNMVRRFLADGFDVYISADHGNTACVGLGRIMGSGVEVETKSHKMVVLKDFADKESLIQKYGLIEYPKYYLPKEYDYLICNVGESLDVKGEAVMTHGGMSLDEVVVPFIKIKAVQNNG